MVDRDDRVYVQLQRHLDGQAVGFPATRAKSEIRLLKHIFTPRQASIAAHLSYKPEPLEAVFSRVEHLVKSPEELADLLDGIQTNGGIGSKTKDGKRYYFNMPLIPGMMEMQVGRYTSEFIKDFDQYTLDGAYGIAFLSTELPQLRTIPVAKSVSPQSQVSTFDEVAALVQQADPPFIVFECMCRKRRLLEGHTCRVTDRKETCLAFASMAQSVSRCGVGREITRDEVMSILEKNQKQGLVLEPSNTEKAEFICSCCGCCCGMLTMHRRLPKPLDYWASNYHSAVDASVCDGCGVCENRCQVGAVSITEKGLPAVVDLNRCVGCGVCVPTCPKKAISLQKKLKETRPPGTREELYDILMAKKKGTLGRLRLTGKFVSDAILTGQTHLLKRQGPGPEPSR